MKHGLLFFSLLFCLYTNAQSKMSFAYDAAGNRVSRSLLLSTYDAKASSKSIQSSSYSDMVGDKQIQIYPNSTTGHVLVEMFGKGDAAVSLSVYNVSGMQVFSQKMQEDRVDVDLSTNPSGIYVLNVEMEGEKVCWKIVKK